MNTKEILFKLCESDHLGSLHGCAETVKTLIEPYVDEVITRRDGSVIALMHGTDKKIMLEAHIDQVGFVVTQVFDDGFLRIAKVGGPDVRALPASILNVFGKQKVPAVVISVPPHLQKEKSDKFPSIDDMLLDTGLGEKAKDIISVGDYAAFSTDPQSMANGRVTARSLDDRAACAALILAAQKLSENRPQSTVIFSFSQGEELNGCGAKTAAFEYTPDHALACDVSFAKANGVPDHKCGKLGKGPMIGISPVLSRSVSDTLVSLAQQKKIEYQLEVMGGETSTDADYIAVTKSGVECGLVSIPQRNMHTPVEIVELSDIENTALLMSAFVMERDGDR